MTQRPMPFAAAAPWLLMPMLATLGACQAPPGPGQNAAALGALPPAHVCQASLPPFGHWQYARDDAVFYAAAKATIAMANDGGWCQIAFEHDWGGRPAQEPLTVTTPPAHGEAIVGSVGVSLRIAYRPAAGFVGSDAFIVHLTAPDPWDIPVTVTVSP